MATVIVSPKPPDAFLSYTRFDNRRGHITKFREHLEDAVREVTGEPFEIFQEMEGIGIGEHWPDKMDQMLDEARFFIPILTPSYFNSTACRDELEKFLHAEAERGRKDLVLPIYYIECTVLEDPNLRAADSLAAEIHKRQRHDWRSLRFSSVNTKAVRTSLHKLALEIVRARRRPMPKVTAPETRAGTEVSASRPNRAPRFDRRRRSPYHPEATTAGLPGKSSTTALSSSHRQRHGGSFSSTLSG